jgi:hypothetical protein
LKKAIGLSPERTRQALAAIKRHPGADFWRNAVQHAARAEYCLRGGWFNFNKLVDEDTLVKLLEGAYDKVYSANDATTPSAPVPGPRTPSSAETKRLYLDRDKAATA